VRVINRYYISRFITKYRRAVDKGLHRISGLIASACKRNLRVRKGPSRPGSPPHAHTRGGLRVIMFHVQKFTSWIGPVKFPRRGTLSAPIPHVHEFGGNFFRFRINAWVRYPKRSYMEYTLDRLRRSNKIPLEFSVETRRLL
jgi:hypothetical protein